MTSVPLKLAELMAHYKEMIQKEVFKTIEPRQLASISPLVNTNIEKEFWTQIQDYPKRGGKYVRSILICLTCEALGGKLEDTIPTATAMELSQNWILIHDDIQDQSTMRRGDKALHLKIGIDHAINAGDVTQILMWKILTLNFQKFQDERPKRIIDEFEQMLMRTAVGQTAEMIFRDAFDLTEEDVYYVLDGKTGYYTIAGPIRLGAIIANYNELDHPELFANINKFGISLGRAFQITDDILDITTDFNGLKERGNDIQEGKRSYILVRLFQKINKSDRPQLISIMKKPMGDRTQEEINQVMNWMETYGLVEEARQRANQYAREAKETLELLPFKDDHKIYYQELVQFLVERTY